MDVTGRRQATGTTPGAVILHAGIKPYVLQVSAAPTATTFATFTLAAATFKDGPYFDEFTSGVLASPSAKTERPICELRNTLPPSARSTESLTRERLTLTGAASFRDTVVRRCHDGSSS